MQSEDSDSDEVHSPRYSQPQMFKHHESGARKSHGPKQQYSYFPFSLYIFFFEMVIAFNCPRDFEPLREVHATVSLLSFSVSNISKKLSITHHHSIPRTGLSMGRSLLGKEDQHSQFLFFEETQINQALRLPWLFTPGHFSEC